MHTIKIFSKRHSSEYISLRQAYMAQERPGYATFVTNFKSKLQPAWKEKKHTDLQSVLPTQSIFIVQTALQWRQAPTACLNL